MKGRRNTTPVFGDFWDAYGLKRDRIAAERAWNRLSAKDRKAACAGIPAYSEDCRRRGIGMMYAQGYLNHRRWEDELDDGGTAAGCQTPPSPAPSDALADMDTW